VLIAVDPTAAAAAARNAGEHARRIGARYNLTVAINNLVFATLALGEWDEAGAVLAAAMHADGLDDDEVTQAAVSALACLRGDAETAAAYSGTRRTSPPPRSSTRSSLRRPVGTPRRCATPAASSTTSPRSV
jgi:hypothetical protein